MMKSGETGKVAMVEFPVRKSPSYKLAGGDFFTSQQGSTTSGVQSYRISTEFLNEPAKHIWWTRKKNDRITVLRWAFKGSLRKFDGAAK